MALSQRIRPDCEAAPWVIEEVKEMEAEIKRLKDQNARYREALEYYAKMLIMLAAVAVAVLVKH